MMMRHSSMENKTGRKEEEDDEVDSVFLFPHYSLACYTPIC